MVVNDRILRHSRFYAHPRERVWNAWTDVAQISKWWGPNGFSTTTHEMDLRPGGIWKFTMHGPDGTDFQNLVEYREVSEPSRLAYIHSDGSPDSDLQFDVTVDLVEEEGGTRLTLTSTFESAELLRQLIKDFGAEEGAHQTLERLAELLDQSPV